MPIRPASYRTDGMPRALSGDPARQRRVGSPNRNQIEIAVVGHEDPNPQYVRLEGGQAFVEVTLQPSGEEIVARLAGPSAGEGAGWYIPLDFGCRVVCEYLDGDPNHAIITGRLHDEKCAMPAAVAGVQTGAASATGQGVSPAPNWHFLKIPDQQLMAIETGLNGDLLIHAGASVHVKAGTTGQIHLDGVTRLGAAPLTPPVGSVVGPAGESTPAVPAVPALPDAPPVPTPGPPAPVPFIGQSTSIIRAKDGVQSHVAIDPTFWAWVTAVGLHPVILGVIGIPPPVVLNAVHAGQNGPGSLHTASDT